MKLCKDASQEWTDPVSNVERALAAAEGDQWNAIISIQDNAAREDARAAADRSAQSSPLSPLDGIPFVTKDVVDVAGAVTTMGSTIHPETPADTSAEVVRRFRGLGMIPVAKTNCQEYSYGIMGDESAFGRGINPLRPRLLTGGSSFGSAIAVSAGMVPIAIGTDTAGSVRVPAACAAVPGFKPTLGSVPAEGVFPLAESFDTVGFFASTAELLQELWQQLGYDAPTSGAGPADDPGTERTAGSELRMRTSGGMRVGLLASPAAHNGMDYVREKLTPVLERVTGISIVPLPEGTFDLEDFARVYRTVRSFETYRILRESAETRIAGFQQGIQDNLRNDATVTPDAYAEASARVAELRATAEQVFADVDLIISPTLGMDPVDWVDIDQSVRAQLMLYTQPFNILGWPALSLTVEDPHEEKSGFPAAMQIVGRPGDDSAVLDFGVEIARALTT